MKLPGFVGPFAETRSRTFDAEDTINFYYEPGDAGSPRSRAALYGTPGVRLYSWFPVGESPLRGLFSQDGRAFGVSGTTFGEIPDGGGAVTHTGTVAGTSDPVSFASNGTGGNQVFLTAGGEGYIFNTSTNTLAIISDVDFPANAIQTAYIDGYFLVLKEDSRQFNISALLDGTDWDPLDIYERSEGSDNFVSMVQNQREVWFLGTKTSEVWVDTGDALTPFQPIPGVFLQQGCLAPFSAMRCDNTILWMGQNEQGQASVYRANGYTPERISTFPVEQYLSGSDELESTMAFTFQLRGHLFYGLYVSDLDTTLLYDLGTGQWTKWAWWQVTTATWTPHVTNSACHAFSQILVGDRQSRAVYNLDFAAYDDELAGT